MTNPITLSLGSFFVTGNKIHVSDPCYDYHYSGAVTIVSIRHAKHKNIVPNICADCLIGVDSGQAGFFDDAYYQQNQDGDFGDINTFFGLACSLNLSNNRGGIMRDHGVVSETGFGDGSCPLYIGKNVDGKIVAASIIFIDDEELEDF